MPVPVCRILTKPNDASARRSKRHVPPSRPLLKQPTESGGSQDHLGEPVALCASWTMSVVAIFVLRAASLKRSFLEAASEPAKPILVHHVYARPAPIMAGGPDVECISLC